MNKMIIPDHTHTQTHTELTVSPTMRQVAWGDRRRHDAANMGREEGEGFSGTTVQTPTTGSGEDCRRRKRRRSRRRE